MQSLAGKFAVEHILKKFVIMSSMATHSIHLANLLCVLGIHLLIGV